MKYSEFVRARYEELLEQKAARERGEDPRAIIPTGLRDYDARAGLKRGIMTLIGANSGEGKDLWMLHLMTAAAQRGFGVEVLSMEDPAARTVDRSFARETDINSAKLISADVDEKEMARVALAAAECEEWGELIEYTDEALDAREALKLMEESDADLRIVNYVQAFQPTKGQTLEETIRDFCWELNTIAKDQGCATVAFSQVNPVKVEERGQERLARMRWKNPEAPPDVEGFRPYGVSDLAWCTAAGVRAKDLQFLFRPGRYLKREGKAVQDDRMEITRPKNNFGAEGKIVVGVDLKTARFYDLKGSNG